MENGLNWQNVSKGIKALRRQPRNREQEKKGLMEAVSSLQHEIEKGKTGTGQEGTPTT